MRFECSVESQACEFPLHWQHFELPLNNEVSLSKLCSNTSFSVCWKCIEEFYTHGIDMLQMLCVFLTWWSAYKMKTVLNSFVATIRRTVEKTRIDYKKILSSNILSKVSNMSVWFNVYRLIVMVLCRHIKVNTIYIYIYIYIYISF